MTTYYQVIGSATQYRVGDDYVAEWVVAAFASEFDAADHLAKLVDWLSRNPITGSYDDWLLANPHDSLDRPYEIRDHGNLHYGYASFRLRTMEAPDDIAVGGIRPPSDGWERVDLGIIKLPEHPSQRLGYRLKRYLQVAFVTAAVGYGAWQTVVAQELQAELAAHTILYQDECVAMANHAVSSLCGTILCREYGESCAYDDGY